VYQHVQLPEWWEARKNDLLKLNKLRYENKLTLLALLQTSHSQSTLVLGEKVLTCVVVGLQEATQDGSRKQRI
jgi:hypothetical protein